MPETPKPGDFYLLCSDGLSGMIDDDTILASIVAAQGDPRAAAVDLVAKANANGGEDNITVVVFTVAA
jgi:protein phosphatase